MLPYGDHAMSKETRAFARLVREWRRTVGLTQAEAADQFGISRRTLIRLENAQVKRLAMETRDKVLGVIQGEPAESTEPEESTDAE